MILSVTPNPSIDHALFVESLQLGDTNRVLRVERDAGGKGVNLSRVAAELGAKTIATGYLAGAAGAYVRSVLEVQRVLHDFVEVPGETRTNFSVEDNSKTPPTTFNERGPTVTSEEVSKLISKVSILAQASAWVCIGGSLPPGAPVDLYAQLLRVAHASGAKVLIDGDRPHQELGLKAGPDFIKPNHEEAGRLLGREIQSDQEAVSAAKELAQRLGGDHRIVVISRGKKGAVLAQGDTLLVGESPSVEVKSTIGSGDSMLGAMLWAITSGKSLDEALRWGLAAGAATATTDGSEIGRRSVIEELYERATVSRV